MNKKISKEFDQMKDIRKDKNEYELDNVEEELLRKEQESRKMPMPVSGRGVFDIKRIKDEKGEKRQ